MNTEQLLQAYTEITNLYQPIWFWKMDSRFHVIQSNCPHESLFRSLFLRDGRREAMEAHMAISTLPVCYTVSSKFSWVMAFGLADGVIDTIHIMGPFFAGYNDPSTYPDYLSSMELSSEAEKILEDALSKLPVIGSPGILQMAVGLHYCVRLEKLSISEITYNVSPDKNPRMRSQVTTNQFEKSSGRWAMEQELLTKIRSGDASAVNVLSNANGSYTIQAFGNTRNLASARQNIHQLLTLVSRAAVDGGLPQKTSFSLCTDYRNRLEKCHSASELNQISNEFVLDYASRVYRMKHLTSCSPQIRLCCEYIDTHPGDKISLEELASKAGYSSFHLSRKFKQEMNCSIIDYIQKSKLNRAKYLLAHTEQSIDDISADLGFNSRSYFTSVFKNHAGMTPTDYRRQNKCI